MFTFPTYSCRRHRVQLTAIVLAILVIASTHRIAHAIELPTHIAMEVDVVFTLSSPIADVNHFEILGELNTLTASLGTVSAAGSTQIEGQIEATLHLQVDSETGLPVLTGIEIRSSDLRQSPLSLSYVLPVGTVRFSTSELATQLESTTAGGLIPIEFGAFQATSLQLFQNGGTASVSVPARQLEQQDLANISITSLFDPLQANIPEANIALTALQGNEFAVELRVPLDGQMLAFPNVGLPVNLEFQSGVLQATGRFAIVPEPSTLLLALLALGGGLYARGRH